MDSSLVLNRKVMIDLAQTRPKTLEELAAVEGFDEWQLDRFGDELLALCEGFREDLAAGRLSSTRGRRVRCDPRRT